jgi:hypothetical protein
MSEYEQLDWTKQVKRPRARKTDRATSHEAAKGVEGTLRWSQRAVKELFEQKGEMTDRDLVEAYQRNVRRSDVDWPYQSPSGLRTRRDELTALGVLYDTGRTKTYENAYRHTVWGLRK